MIYARSYCPKCGHDTYQARGECAYHPQRGKWYEKRTCRTCQFAFPVECLPYQVQALEARREAAKAASA